MSNWKATFKLLDGKPVPYVWTMPEKPIINAWSATPYDYLEKAKKHNEAIAQARENAVPVKEEFRSTVLEKIWEKENHSWTPDLTRDYDVDMEFEIREETESCMCTESCGYGLGSYDNCKTLKRTKKVAIPKQTKEVEQKVFCIRDQKRRDTFCSLCECTNTPCNQFAIEPVKEQKEQLYSEELLKDWEKDSEYDEPIKKQLSTILTDSHKLKLLADWFDERDKQVLLSGNEVQNDLRKGTRLEKRIKHKILACGDVTKEDRARKGAYVDCLMMIQKLESVAPTDEGQAMLYTEEDMKEIWEAGSNYASGYERGYPNKADDFKNAIDTIITRKAKD